LTFLFNCAIILNLEEKMNIKKIMLIALVLLLGVSSLSAATKVIGTFDSKSDTFQKGHIYITPQVGFNRYAVQFALSGEYAMLKNFGIGASLLTYFWSHTSVIAPTVDGYYHFTWLKVPKLDAFAGLALGFAIYHSTYYYGLDAADSGIYAAPFAGARYWFSKKIAASLRVNFGITGAYWSGVNAMAGVTFML
jgi:hypothetical protein